MTSTDEKQSQDPELPTALVTESHPSDDDSNEISPGKIEADATKADGDDEKKVESTGSIRDFYASRFPYSALHPANDDIAYLSIL